MSQRAFSFATATEIRFGRGTSSGVADAVAGMADSILLVHGSRAASADWLVQAMEAKGVDVARFACPKEPDIALIEAGVDAARKSGAKAVVALGETLEKAMWRAVELETLAKQHYHAMLIGGAVTLTDEEVAETAAGMKGYGLQDGKD